MAVKKAQTLGKKKQTSFTKRKQSRIEILRAISDNTGLPKAHVSSVFSALNDLVHSHMHIKGSGEFTIPMIGIKVRRVKKKATKARRMHSPLTGTEVLIPGKPVRAAIKVTALKPLKLALSS
jgi:hypothetical protein